MGRPGYLSIYADERTQQIFDEFVKIKGTTKSTALTEMLEIYMLCTDEDLYLELKKKYLGVEVAKQSLVQRTDSKAINDYIFIKLGTAYDLEGNPLDGKENARSLYENQRRKWSGLYLVLYPVSSFWYGKKEKSLIITS